MLRKILTNTGFQIIGKLFGAGTTLILTFVLANTIGVGGYGEFVKITTYVGFFFLAADFGLNAIYLKKNYDWNVLFGLRLVMSMILVFIALSILAFLPQGVAQGYTSLTRLGVIFFVPAIIFQAIITSANAIFQKNLRYDFGSISIFFGSLAMLICIYLFRSLFGGLGALLVGSLVTGIVSLWFVRSLTPLSVSFSSRLVLPLLISSIPLGFTLVSNLVYSHIDNVILTLFRQTAEVGTYGFAYKIFETILVIPTFIMNAMYPLFLSMISKSRQEFNKFISGCAIVLCISAIVVTICVWMLSPAIALFNAEFTQSITYIKILSLSLPIFFVSSLVMWALIALGKQWHLAIIYFIGLLLNIVVNIWVVPTYGAIGASWVTVVSEGVILMTSTFILLRL